MLLAERYEAVEELLGVACNIAQLVAHKELQINQHLVVARASRVNLLAHVAELACEHKLHLRVYIFDTLLNDEVALLGLRQQLGKSGEQLLQLALLEKPYSFEHLYMSHRSLDVVLRKS